MNKFINLINKNKKIIIISTIILFEFAGLFLIWKTGNNNKIVTLDDVVMKDFENYKSMFAIYLENEDGSGYTESESNTWPTTNYAYNSEKSGCMDTNGKKMENSLTFENNKVKVKTNAKAKCYLYFDKATLEKLCEFGTSLGSDCLVNNSTSLASLSDDLIGGMYRFQGTDNVDNCICFGTSDKEECVNDSGTYMYRIIGVDENGKLKLIKKDNLDENASWVINGTEYENYYYSDSNIYTNLNGSGFLDNKLYVPTNWKSKIEKTDWFNGEYSYYYKDNADYSYEIESDLTNGSINAEIGLMYVHDYQYSDESLYECTYPYCEGNSWIINPNTMEWTMTSAGIESGVWTIYAVGSDGLQFQPAAYVSYPARPVFYLNSNEMYMSGNGTENDPVLIMDASVVINSDDEYTANSNVTLTLNATDATEMCISNTESCTNWIDYQASYDWTLTSGSGEKIVYVWYKFANGNKMANPVSDTIISDTAAPTNGSVSINNGNTYTNSVNVTLTLSAYDINGIKRMCISNTTSCSDWEPYTISKSWTLTSGYGEKKVYIWFKDAAGNISTMYSDSITLGMNLHDYLINNSVSGLKKVYIGKDNLYRFSGTSGNSGINNYICLGAASCSSSSDNMYRILGVNPSNGEVKVVKATTYNNGTKYVWHNSMANINWLTSDLYKNTVSKIYDNLSFKNMIVQNHIWNIGAAATHTGLTSREIVIDYEDNATGYATMGIISLTDFYLAYNGTRNWFSSYDTSTNWLNIGQSVYEWTMTYYGLTSDVYIAWNFMEGIGYSPDWYLNYANTIRPTFYLKPEVLWVEGDGTVNAPFKVGININ